MEENFGSNFNILYPNFFKALIQDFPVSRLTSLSLEVPPKITRIFFFIQFYFFPIIFISNSNLTPVFKKTLFFTSSISISISEDFAFPLFKKKLECCSDI